MAKRLPILHCLLTICALYSIHFSSAVSVQESFFKARDINKPTVEDVTNISTRQNSHSKHGFLDAGPTADRHQCFS